MKFQYIRNKMVLALVVAMLMVMCVRATDVTAQTSTSYACFPTCSETDGRFLSMAGVGVYTLTGDTITIQFAVPGTETDLEIGIFDGDSGGYWDDGLAIPVEYTLYADPHGDLSGSTVINQWSGDSMPDNAWHTISLPNTPEAMAESGHYFYYMTTRLTDASVVTASNFKIRVIGTLTVGGSVELTPLAFAFIGALGGLDDAGIIYPAYPDLSPTTYDGSWNFYFMVPPAISLVEIWDGDMDFGSSDGVDEDTDDPDTSNELLPPWAEGTPAVLERAVGIGVPADDTGYAAYLRSPSIVYDIYSPNGDVYANPNPSGNLEWEHFSIDTAPFDPALMDYHAEDISAGIWQVRVAGVDLSNLNAWRFPYPVLGVDENDDPVPPLNPYLLGDTVWYDTNLDGVQDPGEAGIPGVIVNLVDADGNVIGTATTDAEGYYIFEVDNGTYTVQVAQENFEPGGALEGLSSTTGGEVITDVIDGASVLTYDFGYAGGVCSSSISNQVWYDSDGDGFFEPSDGETGVEGVAIVLKADLDGNGTYETDLAVTWTDANGQYIFDDLPPGSYMVVVWPTNFKEGYPLEGLSYSTDRRYAQFDDANRRNYWKVTLGECEDHTWADFGFTVPGSIGDRVWFEQDGDGLYEPDAGEMGIEGVRIILRSDPDGDGSLNYVGETFTNADGQYIFKALPAGEYTVSIDQLYFKSGYPLDGLVWSADQSAINVDGANRMNDWSFVLGVGEDYTWADFGFYTLHTGGAGCPVSYWKQRDPYDAWDYYSPTDMYDDVFGVPYFKKLIRALKKRGGGEIALGRQATAALLNAEALGADYLYTEADIKAMVQGAYLTGNYNAIKDLFKAQNTSGCPLD